MQHSEQRKGLKVKLVNFALYKNLNLESRMRDPW